MYIIICIYIYNKYKYIYICVDDIGWEVSNRLKCLNSLFNVSPKKMSTDQISDVDTYLKKGSHFDAEMRTKYKQWTCFQPKQLKIVETLQCTGISPQRCQNGWPEHGHYSNLRMVRENTCIVQEIERQYMYIITYAYIQWINFDIYTCMHMSPIHK